MKFKVSYYDYDTDKYVTKDCDEMHFDNGKFSFYPIDDPVKSYKLVIIHHPIITIHQNKDKLSISVVGYQYIKEGGYWQTTTTIENIRED